MPKMKTNKSAAKRIKVTASGKLLRGRAFGNHFLSKKSKGRKRNMHTSAEITGKTAENMRRALALK